MIAETISFYGSRDDLIDCLSRLTDPHDGHYKNVSDNKERLLPIDLKKQIMPLGIIGFNLSVASQEQKHDTEHLTLSISAVRKGLIPAFLLYKHINLLEQDLISAVTTSSPKRVSVASRKILQVAMDQGTISEEQTTHVFQNLLDDPSDSNVDCIFKLNEMLQHGGAPAYWQDAFVTGLFHYYASYIKTQDHVELIKRIKEDGKVDEATELRLLMLINRKFEGASDELQDAILEEVHQSVMHSTDSNFIDANRIEGSVDAEDIILLRRTIFGAGSDGGIGISRREAELLFRIDMDTASVENHKDWPEFFATAIRSYLMNCGEVVNVISEEERVWLLSNLQRYSKKTKGLKCLYDQLIEENIRLSKKVKDLLVEEEEIYLYN